MYDSYYFKLEWHEVPLELQAQKINEWLEKQYEDEVDPDEEDISIDEYVQNEQNRASAERSISAHFPMYF